MPSKDPAKVREALYKWRKAHPEQYKKYVREYSRKRYWEDPQRISRINHKLKIEVIAAYGNACACCGETILEFLTIDHKKNDGAQHRRSIGKGFYRWLRKMGYPKDDFQCLCMNCQWGKKLNNGVCPHQEFRRPLRALPFNKEPIEAPVT
jgi:hypothetical protein